MLNFLVDKAIDKTSIMSDPKQPIFTISYSSINAKAKSLNCRQFDNKTAINKIPKINKNYHNVFQKWKSKTLEKLQDHTLNYNSFFPINPSHNHSHHTPAKPKSSPRTPNLNPHSPHPDPELTELKTSFIVHKKKPKPKAYSFQQSPIKQKSSPFKQKQTPIKSVYLQYKDDCKEKKKKVITLSNFYQKKLIENHIGKITNGENSSVLKTENSEDHEDDGKAIRPKKNVSFFNTIQYKTVPKEEIRHYKNDEFDHSKRHILSRVENTFVRTTKDTSKGEYNIFESAVTTLRAGKLTESKPEPEQSQNQKSTQSVNIRKVYTEKRSRKMMRDFMQDPETLRVMNIDNCRPWSPVKTNPLFINEEDFLFEQSRTFNIFSSLQEVNQHRF